MRRIVSWSIVIAILAVATLSQPGSQIDAASFTVTNTNDSGAGSLRQAIIDANANVGTDTINFNIQGAGPHTIQPTSTLPNITGAVRIDGTTQPGFAGSPIIELDGSFAGGGVHGLHITAGNSRVRSLVINPFDGAGIMIEGGGGNLITGNYIGTDPTGTVAVGNAVGVQITQGAKFNTVGRPTNHAKNIISGNDGVGVLITREGTDNNIVLGNYIGLDVNGTTDLGNSGSGIVIRDGAQFNTVGGTTFGSRNNISGNGDSGVSISGLGTDNNTVSGNYIGTDVTGTMAVPNRSAGVGMQDGAQSNTIGGTLSGESNIIAFNGHDGVSIEGNLHRIRHQQLDTLKLCFRKL